MSKGKVLIVDDAEINRMLMADILGDEYEVIEASDGVEAVETLSSMHDELTLMFLDINMPRMNGIEVLEKMNKSGWINEVPVIIISSEEVHKFIDTAYDLGATEYIQRPFDEKMVKHRAENTIMLYAKQRSLEKMVIDQMLEKEKSNIMMVDILSHIVEFRNGESGMHVRHIRVLTEILLEEIHRMTDKYDLSTERISLISNASALHDIGKIVIPDEVLNKPGRFTPEERLIMQNHSAAGAEMLEKLPYYGDEELVRVARDICRWHHERYDGKGYPDGLVGDDIPIHAQVVALADVYDALTSERVYKPAYTHEQAMDMIQAGECGSFSPLLLDCLRHCGERLKHELSDMSTDNNMARSELSALPKSVMEGGISRSRLRFLENERIKHKFHTENTHALLFEYDASTDVLTLSPWGAQLLGVPEVISGPMQDEKVAKLVVGDNIERQRALVHAATPENPKVEYDCTMVLPDGQHDFHVVARPLWENGDSGAIVGMIGRTVEKK